MWSTPDLKTLLMALVAASCVSAFMAASLPQSNQERENNHMTPDLDLGSHPLTNDLTQLSWLRYLLHHNKPDISQEIATEKRFSNFGMPYIKYKVDKRNNGVWIWMPAQGYVSVPKQQQELMESGGAKQGKIMRYGK